MTRTISRLPARLGLAVALIVGATGAASADYRGRLAPDVATLGGALENYPLRGAQGHVARNRRAPAVPVAGMRTVTSYYQVPVTSYVPEFETRGSATRAYMRPITVYKTFKRTDVVPVGDPYYPAIAAPAY